MGSGEWVCVGCFYFGKFNLGDSRSRNLNPPFDTNPPREIKPYVQPRHLTNKGKILQFAYCFTPFQVRI